MDASVSHIWQSTLVAGFAAALALMLRNNRASVRYWVWFAASMKFLVPFAALSSMVSVLPWPGLWLPDNEAVAAMNVLFHSSALAPVPDASVPAIFAVWLAGVLIVFAKWFREWSRVAAIVRAADPIADGPVHDALRRVERAAGARTPIRIVSSRSRLEPGVFGLWKPVLIWPTHLAAGLRDAHIEPILAHEVAHVRRHDNLLGMAQMLVSALLWFHPMVWWIGARMIEERERACDEQVLALGQGAATYRCRHSENLRALHRVAAGQRSGRHRRRLEEEAPAHHAKRAGHPAGLREKSRACCRRACASFGACARPGRHGRGSPARAGRRPVDSAPAGWRRQTAEAA